MQSPARVPPTAVAAVPSDLSVYPIAHYPPETTVLAIQAVAAAGIALKAWVVERQYLQSPSAAVPTAVAVPPLALSVYPVAHNLPLAIVLGIHLVAAAGIALKIWVLMQYLQSPARV